MRKRQQKNKWPQPLERKFIKPGNDEKVRDMMFKPMIYTNKTGTIDFDYLRIPFLVKNDLLFIISIMDGCGLDISAYVECHNMKTTDMFDSYENGLPVIKECLSVQRMTDMPYYFNHLDKMLQRYMYALELFIRKDIMKKEQAITIVKELGFDENDVIIASNNVKDSIDKKQRQDIERRRKDAMGDMMLSFVSNLLKQEAGDENQDEESKKEDDEENDQ